MATTETTLRLRELAREAATQRELAAKQRAERVNAAHAEQARRAGVSVFQRLLSVPTEPEQWIPTGDPNRTAGWSATGEFDGLRFLATETSSSFSGSSYTLYLLQPCENTMYPPHDKQAEVISLAGLHAILVEGVEDTSFRCSTCSWRASEERGEATVAAVSTPAEQLAAALAAFIHHQISG